MLGFSPNPKIIKRGHGREDKKKKGKSGLLQPVEGGSWYFSEKTQGEPRAVLGEATKRKRSYVDKAEAHMASTLQLTHTKQSCWALQLKLVLQQAFYS